MKLKRQDVRREKNEKKERRRSGVKGPTSMHEGHMTDNNFLFYVNN